MEAPVIEAFGPPGTFQLLRRFRSSLGAPKSVWRDQGDGALLLLGSLPPSWPEPERLEALLPWLNRIHTTSGDSLAVSLTLRCYRRSLAGPYTVLEAGHRWFLASYQSAARPCRQADGGTMAAALAAFHHLAEQQISGTGPPMAPETLVDLLEHWLLPGLKAGRARVAVDLRPALDAALRHLDRLMAQRLAALDALPRRLIHGDWQPRNLLLGTPPGAKGVVHVLDSESCRMLPRLFDVYFLLAWDDLGTGWRRPRQALGRLRRYLACSGGLQPQERTLLPDLLVLKALSNVAWACEGPHPWRRRTASRRRGLRGSLRLAAALADLDTSIL
jgi:hypothetical protein